MPRDRGVLLAGLLVALTLTAYVPALSAGFVWDDDAYVTSNPNLQSVAGLARIWLEPDRSPQYYPLVFTSFWIEHRLWGEQPAGYHVVNVLLHAGSAVLLWRLLRDLAVPGAWLAAAVFALHPVHVESVAWVTERKNVLSGLFYLASTSCLLRFFGVIRSCAGRPPAFWYAWGLLLFVCALLAKTVTASLPAALLLVLWWKRPPVSRRKLLALVPLLALGVAMGLLTAWLERHHVGAEGPEWDLSWVERMLIAGRALWFYAGKLLWPVRLTFNYPRFDVDPGAAWQYAYPLGVLIVLGLLWGLRARLGRAPLVGALFFCGTLLPALGFLDVYPFRYSWVADHFQYLASLGGIALLAAPFARARAGLAEPWRSSAAVAAATVLLLLGAGTWRHSRVFTDLDTLWTDTIEKNPGSWMAHNNLGNLLADRGRLDEAIEHYARALSIRPDNPRTHFNLGTALGRLGRTAEAIESYSRALALDPDHADAHNNLGNSLAGVGRFEEAAAQYREVLRLRPADAAAHNNLGNALASLGRYDEAIEQYSTALELDPGHTQARANLDLARELRRRASNVDEAGAAPEATPRPD